MELEFTPSSALYIKFENDSLNGTFTLLHSLPLSKKSHHSSILC